MRLRLLTVTQIKSICPVKAVLGGTTYSGSTAEPWTSFGVKEVSVPLFP